MQLAHLLPYIDAEINRLQKARDLLAFVPAPFDFSADLRVSRSPSAEHYAAPSPLSLVQEDVTPPTDQVKPAIAPEAAPMTVADVSAMPRLIRTRERRASMIRNSETRNDARKDRRGRLIVLDTALRGSVPAGPVVVSAEDVRKSQASKAAQAERAAEARKAGMDPFSVTGWRGETSNVRSMDSLLQRLIHLGEEVGTTEELSQFSPLGQRKSFEASHAPLASKLH